ncbi:MAG TPA: histidine kinase, partial [Solirubrobacteraceae bacterium]|nr:histidine kinase [Solirubrobacteraceae bacterium]
GLSSLSTAIAIGFMVVVSAGARLAAEVSFGIMAETVAAFLIAGLASGAPVEAIIGWTAGFVGMWAFGLTRRAYLFRAVEAEQALEQARRAHAAETQAAALAERARIAREIHDVLAHALAGLTIQLEATSALLEQGADTDAVLVRVRRARQLAQEGLRETRRAVGALRGEVDPAPAGIEALVAEYRADGSGTAQLTIDGDRGRLSGPTGDTVIRVLQEALTNVRKHAPGADVSVAVHAGEGPRDAVTLVVEDHPGRGQPAPPSTLAASGGGFGVRGMRERAEQLGGRLSAEAAGPGWRVQLTLPGPGESAGSVIATEEAG